MSSRFIYTIHMTCTYIYGWFIQSFWIILLSSLPGHSPRWLLHQPTMATVESNPWGKLEDVHFKDFRPHFLVLNFSSSSNRFCNPQNYISFFTIKALFVTNILSSSRHSSINNQSFTTKIYNYRQGAKRVHLQSHQIWRHNESGEGCSEIARWGRSPRINITWVILFFSFKY